MKGGLGQQRDDGGECDNCRQRERSGNHWCIYICRLRFNQPFCLVPVLVRAALPGCGGLSPAEGRDAITL